MRLVDMPRRLLVLCRTFWTAAIGLLAVAPAHADGTPGGTSVVLFEQPFEPGIGGGLLVPPASGSAPPTGVFEMLLWQPNPNTSDGQLVPNSWDAGVWTGFSPPPPVSGSQLAFQNQPGSSTAQMSGEMVGAYINSADLPDAPPGQKMMITPQFIYVPGTEPVPFANPQEVLSSWMNLQVPTALGDDTYIVADFIFVGPNGVKITYGIKLFGNGATNPQLGSSYDVNANSYILSSPLSPAQPFVTPLQGVTTATSPWVGWQYFGWTISQPQFASALNYLASLYPSAVQSVDPGAYLLQAIHLNAEFHFQPAPAALGWSMIGWSVLLTDGG